MLTYPKPTKIRESKYLKGLHHEICDAKVLGGCSGDVVGAHLDIAGNKGIATKTDDCYAGPLCHFHHLQESNGSARFWHTIFAEDTWFLVQCLKAYRLIRFMKWLVSQKREDEVLDVLKRF